jgi:CP12 domain
MQDTETTVNLTLEQRINKAIEDAHAASEKYGSDSQECKVAWDIVEELQAEASHQKDAHRTAFDAYCEEFPEAPEARIYDD